MATVNGVLDPQPLDYHRKDIPNSEELTHVRPKKRRIVPNEKRKRVARACDTCKRRKQKVLYTFILSLVVCCLQWTNDFLGLYFA